MNDHRHYSRGRDSGSERPRRNEAGLRLPFGAMGVALVFALALGLFGLMMPQEWLETLSFQLYLDKVTSAAIPPLGTTARIAAALAFGAGGALFGWTLGRLFGVRSSDVSLHALINRLRGVGDDDEADAPSLRAADRHPDAPARRPFSAARDIAPHDEEWDDAEEDALLLDTQFAPIDDALAPAPVGGDSGTSFDRLWTETSHEPVEPVAAPSPFAPPPPVTRPVERQTPLMPQPSGLDADPAEVSLPAPSLDDWELEADLAPAAPFARAVPPVAPVAPPVTAAPTPAPSAMPAPEPAPLWTSNLPPVEPLDLSAARLDDLLVRLESGLVRRGGAVPPAPAASAVADIAGNASLNGRPLPSPQVEAVQPASATAPSAPVAPVEADPAYPHDPALAAALKTLRRLNQQATA